MAYGAEHRSFVGTWMCQFYRWSAREIQPPGPPFPLTFEHAPGEHEFGNTLSGFFPTPQREKNAILKGTLSHERRVWTGTFEGLESGTVVFVLAEDGKSFHGAWVSDKKEGPPQPWWGTRYDV
jgi:hypothetical protein